MIGTQQLSIVTLLLVSQASSFVPMQKNDASLEKTTLFSDTPKGPAGSFFNPVPEDSGEGSPSDDIDGEIFEVIRKRRESPIAAKPSTINGVPSAKASGFGAPKSPPKKESKKPYIAVGPPDKRINDPTKPEYDDQGYTLYADEKTGEKSRVFEALVDYPCEFTMKIVGANEGAFVEEMVALVAEACDTDKDSVSHSTRVLGKWTSVTVKAPVQSAEMLYALYEQVDRDPRVKFKF